MITECAWCGKKIRNTRKAIIRTTPNGSVAYFCSRKCNRTAQEFEKWAVKVERELGSKWLEVYVILIDFHFRFLIRGREIKCENCLDYISGVCKGGDNPFECFFHKVKVAKEMGMRPSDMISFVGF